MDHDRDEHRVIVEGIAALAVSLAEMGATEDQARGQLIGWLQAVGASDSGVLREAAVEVGRGPLPVDESPEEIERALPIREMLGVPSAAQELAAALNARVWLERLADDLDAAMD